MSKERNSPHQPVGVKTTCVPTRRAFLKASALTYPDFAALAVAGESAQSAPWDWSDELVLFNPHRDGAWGKFMHLPGSDNLNNLAPAVPAAIAGYAYAPFLLNRFTRWDPLTRRATLYYLMSTFVPYQIVLMRSEIQFS